MTPLLQLGTERERWVDMAMQWRYDEEVSHSLEPLDPVDDAFRDRFGRLPQYGMAAAIKDFQGTCGR